MAETDRSEAQQRREDARRQRRESHATTADDPQDESAVDPEDEAHAGLKHAAKVAAAGAAVGAAVGAALAARDGESDEDEGATAVDEQREPAAERDGAVTEQEPPTDEPAERDEPDEPRDEPTAVEQPEAEADAAAEPEPDAPPEPDDDRPRQGVAPEETVEVVRRAREQLQALQGRDAESVSSLERTAQGWTVALEVVELPRVPNSTDVMASYELLLDEEKNVISFTRGRRYYRSQADRDGQW